MKRVEPSAVAGAAGSMHMGSSLLARIQDSTAGRLAVAILAAGILFGLILLVLGKDPLQAYAGMLRGALGDSYGWTEVLVKICPLVLCAVAAAIAAKVGLINVGADGQFQIGMVAATAVALYVDEMPAPIYLPLLAIAGFAGGAAWGGIAGVLRAGPGLNEAICTLLLNFVALRVVDSLVHGSWKDPRNFNWPFSPPFPDSARLPTFGDSRAHMGILVAIVVVVLFALLMNRTRWGYTMRVVGGNAEAARRAGVAIRRYLIGGMLLGGGIAGLAGMIELAGIHGRLQPGIGVGYGYIGFLASWLAGGRPVLIIPMSALLAVIAVGGEALQISASVPSSSVNILMALILFFVLGSRTILVGRGGARA